MNNDLVWEEFNIKNIKLKNRIVRSATNEHLGSFDGIITIRRIDKISETENMMMPYINKNDDCT